ncbi:MAG: succinyl-diaminopimelate desuccinylase [Acidimicrobiales bacterium]
MNIDLLKLTAVLVDVPSVSGQEAAIADHVEGMVRPIDGLTVARVAESVVARTDLGRPYRLVLAGHLDTVPPNGNDRARIVGDTLWGLGACDMKGGDAVLLALAQNVPEPAVDVTYVFYACEEVDAAKNQLGHLFAEHPDLVAGDAAILAEPTGAVIEAGCQGTLRLSITLAGVRAHSARPWMGRNAIHRLGRVLQLADGYEGRRPVIDGCEFREALQAVAVDGGVAGNVVPDRATVAFNHRFAPDRTVEEATESVRELLAPALSDGDVVELVDSAPAAPPGLEHPLLRSLASRSERPRRAKLGWTDVARFVAAGIPALNFGPGDPMLAHNADERVERADLDAVYAALADLLTNGADVPTS